MWMHLISIGFRNAAEISSLIMYLNSPIYFNLKVTYAAPN